MRKDCTERLDDDKISSFVDIKEDHLIVNNSEHDNTIQSQSGVTTTSPVGRLRSKICQWRLIGTNRYILDVIQNGYKMPLFTTPKPVELSNNKSALENAEFVDQEIEKLLGKNCIEMVSSKPRVVNPLTVAGNKTKQRLVLDARQVRKRKCF